jgi:DNA-binding response OmpR family regulator
MKKVMIVEDSKFIADAIKIMLESKGIQVMHVSDGSKAISTAKKESINLIILDLMMPDVSGTQVLAMLKKDKGTKNIPTIILTARTDALKWDDSLKKCDKFMTKPFDNKELVDSVISLMK